MASVTERKTTQEVSTTIFDFPEHGWEVRDCTDQKIQALAIDFFRAFTADERDRTALASEDRRVLNKGAWYANEYLEHLKTHRQFTRLNWLKERGAFYHGLPPKGFIQPSQAPNFQDKMTDKVNGLYIVKPDVLPSEALDELLPGKNTKPYFIDCQSGIEIAHYCALRVILGRDRFDSYFASEGENPLTISPFLESTPIYKLCDVRTNTASSQIGDGCYFANVPVYRVKHMDGEAGGWHVLCSSISTEENRYLGFGLKGSEMTARDIYTQFAEAFNKDYIPLNEILPKSVAAKRGSSTYQELTREKASLVKMLILTPEAIESAAIEYPNQVGQHVRKYRLSEAGIKHLLVNRG